MGDGLWFHAPCLLCVEAAREPLGFGSRDSAAASDVDGVQHPIPYGGQGFESIQLYPSGSPESLGSLGCMALRPILKLDQLVVRPSAESRSCRCTGAAPLSVFEAYAPR